MPTWRSSRLRLLHFDTESRPLSYHGSDFTTPEITAIGYKFARESGPVTAWVLGHECSACGHNDGDNLRDMLEGFLVVWNAAEIVSGHNLIRHDLKRLNAMLLEHGMPPLGPKVVSDTYADLKKREPGFGSQSTLAEMLGVKAAKVGMSTPSWRTANRLLPPGLAKTERRVVGDVRQHIALRRRLLELNWLHAPRMWRP